MGLFYQTQANNFHTEVNRLKTFRISVTRVTVRRKFRCCATKKDLIVKEKKTIESNQKVVDIVREKNRTLTEILDPP